ncbi:MAG: sugar ABC transporter ATP-binding protein [Planctomycetales bacterium]
MNVPDKSPLLVVENVTKRFPGVTALNKICLSLAQGEVLALIGENGAGKSTLMKILAGVQTPDEGSIHVGDRRIKLDSVQAAQANGIALIHQELNLSGNLSVADNIFLGREPLRYGLIDKKKIRDDARSLLTLLDLDVSPETIVDTLSIGQQQLVEIARALSVNAQVLIMDEPTSSLSQHETERLMEVVKDLRARDVSVIYISHRLGEVKELADRVTVFRDGENAGDLAGDEINHSRMVQLMVGRDISQFYVRSPHEAGDTALEVKGLQTAANPGCRLDFTVRAREIVGIAGLVGAGRTELFEVLFGVQPAIAGVVFVSGQQIALRSPLDAIRSGIALVPEDRKQQGIILEMTVRTNIGLAGLRQHRKKAGFLNAAQEANDAAVMINRLKIKTPNPHQMAKYLSGGNQQKVVLGKWLAIAPKVLLLDEPTRGIDVGAKQEIYALMDELAKKGVAILFVSSEMEEILGMSDRTLVMHEGQITGELMRDELSEEAVMQLATGNVAAASS